MTLEQWIRPCVKIVLPEPTAKGQVRADSPLGLNMQLELRRFTFEQMEQALAMAERMGIKWSREEFHWYHLMPRPGEFHWERIEQAVDLSLAHGVSIMGLFAYWDGPWTPQDGPIVYATDAYQAGGIRDYCTLVRAAVRRFKDRVKVWQIWNEPNGRVDPVTGKDILRGFWKGTPEQYAALLRAAYTTCKEEDPDCTVVGFNCALADVQWLEQLFAQGLLDYADVVAFHPYRWLQQPEDQADALLVRCFDAQHPLRWSDLVGEAQAVRALVRRYAGQGKPVWVTELSWSAALDNAGQQELDVAKDYLRAHLLLLGPGGVGKVFWYDICTENVGLSGPGFRPRYLSAAACVLSQALEGKHFSRTWKVGPSNYALLWQGAEEDVLALWSACPTPQFVAVDLEPGGWQLVDMFGAPQLFGEREPTPPLTVPLGDAPRFLVTRAGALREVRRVSDYLYELPRNFGPGALPEDPYGTRASTQT